VSAGPLVTEDILAFRMISDPRVSPDGGRVAFVLTEQNTEENRQLSTIWAVPSDGSEEARRLSQGTGRDARPRWSPDGRWLGFLGARERDWAKDLFVVDLRGGEAHRVATLPRGIDEFAWSPDSQRFCLLGRPEYPDDPDRGAAPDPAEARRRYQERVRHIERFRYRLDGQGPLDDEPRQVWVCELDGGRLRMITDGPSEPVGPRWISDREIAFLGNRNPDHDRSEVHEVYAVPAAGGEVRALTANSKPTEAFSISPEGHIATVRGDDRMAAFGGGHMRPFVGDVCLTRHLDRSSVPAVLVDTTPGREPLDPIWAGGQVYFDIGDQGAVQVYRARSGARPEVVLGGRRVIAGAAIGGPVLAFISTSLEDPVSLRAANLDGSDERVLFDPNPWVCERAIGQVREFDFEHDGRKIDAWAVLPPGREEGQKVPTLLYIHGGPHAAYGWSFQFVFQILAGAGYAVVYCNPPGSQTYEEEFARVLTGQWGELDFPYFIDLVDRAVEAGFADPERLGVGGASYGGFSTLWVVAHTGRFKAAVAARPVSHLVGFYGSSDVGWSFGEGSMGAEPWEDSERFRRLSPATYAAGITTPLRLIASTGDLRTPLEQAEQVFIRLRKMGKPVDLIVFHGEPHAVVLMGKPWNRIHHMRVVLDWFDRHLKA